MGYPRLGVNLLGCKLESPCIVASSFQTRNVRLLRLAEQHGAGGISTKAAFLPDPPLFKPDIYVLPKRMGIICPGDKRLNVKEATSMIQEIKQESRMMIIANMSMLPPSLGGLGPQTLPPLAIELEGAGADALEVCVPSTDPDLAREVTQTVKAAVRIPVICKLSIITSSLSQVAQACEEGGANAITVIDSLPAAAPIDIWNNARSLYMNLENFYFGLHPLGALSGSAIFPIACYAVAEVSQTVKIPVIGVGGVTTWEDAVQMIMWGASAIQICTAIILRGFQVIDDVNRGLEDFMEKKGYSSIEDFRGLALKRILPADKIEFKDVQLTVRRDLCDLCERCLHIGQCLAISLRDDAIFLDNEECIQCGTCVWICPQHAIEVQPRAQHE